MFENSFLKSTGQLWRLYVAFFLVLLGFALILLILTGVTNESAELSMVVVAIGLLLGMGGFMWACISVRCPKCETKLLWTVLTEKAVQNWLVFLIGLRKCPVCGHD